MRSIFIWLVGLTILLPLITGLIRLRRMGANYQPFFILLVTGFINELINGYIVGIRHTSNAINSNIFTLLEWLLILWQFQTWGSFRSMKKTYYILLVLSCTIWITENLVLGHIREFSPYFRFFDSFFIVLLSVNKINFMITHDNRNLLRHPGFLISIGFIIFFIYKIVYEWAYQTSLIGATDITTTIILLNGHLLCLTKDD